MNCSVVRERLGRRVELRCFAGLISSAFFDAHPPYGCAGDLANTLVSSRRKIVLVAAAFGHAHRRR
jgi:hypothetical protein